MRGASKALQAAALLAAVCLAALAGAVPAHAQSFFAESDALRPNTAVEVMLSDLTENVGSSSGSTSLAFSRLDNSLRRASGRVRVGPLGIGGSGEQRRFHQTTNSFDLSNEVDQSSGYASLGLFGGPNAARGLIVVLATGERHERFGYDSYLRQVDTTVAFQGSLVLHAGFLLAGYTQGQEALGLRVDDLSFDQERYRFLFRSALLGVQFGNLRRFGAELVVQDKQTPAVNGTVINLLAGSERQAQLALVAWHVRVTYVEERQSQTFTNASRFQRDVTQRELQLGVPLNPNLVVGLSQQRTNSLQGLTLSGLPVQIDSTRQVTTLQVQLQF